MKCLEKENIKKSNNLTCNDKQIKNSAAAIVKYYNKHKLKRIILIGNTGNPNSNYTISLIASILLKNGIEIHNVGICSYPCLAYLTKKYNYPLGLIIGSFNNLNDIKFFSNKYTRLNFNEEFNFLKNNSSRLKNDYYSKFKNIEQLKQDYIFHLKSIIKFSFPCIFDCSNGGTNEICKNLFGRHHKININSNITNIKMLSTLCIKRQQIGFSFNIDGEISYMVDTNGNIINQDKILKILSQFKHLAKNQNEIKEFFNIKDGILVAIVVANTIQLTKKSLKELVKEYE